MRDMDERTDSPHRLQPMVRDFTDSDEGKRVVTADGDEIHLKENR